MHGQVPQQPPVVGHEAGQPPGVVVVQDQHPDVRLGERRLPLGQDLVRRERVQTGREDVAERRDPGGTLDVEERGGVLGSGLPEPVGVHALSLRAGPRHGTARPPARSMRSDVQHSREVL
nr:hypothetical protein GCM10025730_24510 [Promicromonospora thailandica]